MRKNPPSRGPKNICHVHYKETGKQLCHKGKPAKKQMHVTDLDSWMFFVCTECLVARVLVFLSVAQQVPAEVALKQTYQIQ